MHGVLTPQTYAIAIIKSHVHAPSCATDVELEPTGKGSMCAAFCLGGKSISRQVCMHCMSKATLLSCS